MDCETCKDKRSQVEPVSFAVFESMKATMERTIKKLWIVIILQAVIILGLFVYEAQWETFETTVSAEQTTEGGGSNYAVAGDMYGEANG